MPQRLRKRSWTDEDLIHAIPISRSISQVLTLLKLRPTGGNYSVIHNHIKRLNLNTTHFLGMGWNIGLHFRPMETIPLEKILVVESTYQTHRLKQRLIASGIRKECCEICGWAELSKDGRIPLELDHINGNRLDHRIENLRILCPNCHSLQLTHRGRNKGANGGIGRRSTLKKL